MIQEPTTTDELAEQWHSLSRTERIARFRSIPPGEADDFFLSIDTEQQAELILALPVPERRMWIRLLAPDDAADLIQHVDEARP